MNKKVSTEDEEFIRKCILLSDKSIQNGDAPFAAIVVKDGKIVSESMNNSKNRISDHAEVIALHKAHQKLNTSDLSSCVLYSNCEPCPMCSFMIREYKISKVVFSLPSPFMGGFSRWRILQDNAISQFEPFFKKPPQIIGGVLELEAKKIFDKTPLWMFGSNVNNQKI